MKEKEIECLQKELKGNTMNKLRKLKAIHCRSLETDSPITSRKCGAWESETKNVSKCDGQASKKSSRSEFNPHSIKDQKPKAGATRKLLQRSISAAADRNHSVLFGHVGRSSSLRRNSGPEVDVNSVGGRGNLNDRDDDKTDRSFEDILNAMRGAPYAVETFTSDDTSPLIQPDIEPLKGARNSFDNLEITESTSSLIEMISSGNSASVENKCLVNPLPTRRRNLELKILTPGYEGVVNCNLKKMSAVDEQQMNEVIELANSFSRLSANDRTCNGPHTPGSLSNGCHSPGGSFFSFHKNRSVKEEKKTFAEELSLQATEAGHVVTPAALEAYEALVKKAIPGRTDVLWRTDVLGLFDENFAANGISESISPGCSREPLMSHLALDMKHPIVPDNLAPGSKKDDKDFPSLTFPTSAHRNRETFALNRSMSLGNPERSNENAGNSEVIDFLFSSLTLLPEKVNELDDLSPLAHQASSPPSQLRGVRPELLKQRSESGKAFVAAVQCSPPPLPEKKSRRDGVLPTEDSPPRYQAPLPPPPAVPPPALPPRIPLRPSRVNSRPYERCFPLASEIPPHRSRSEATTRSDVLDCRPQNLPQKILRQTSATVVPETRPNIKEMRSKGLCDSVESRLSCESDVGNVTPGSEDGVFGSLALPCRPAKSCIANRSASLAATDAGDASGSLLNLNIKKVKLNAAELGLHDKADLFWVKSVNFDLPEKSQSENDLLLDVCAPIPGRYETSDSVSYEDLMDFALDGPLKTSSSHSLMCDEVRILMKMFSNDITVEDCMGALVETFWDVHSAVKLIKLKQVMSTGLADKQQCKQALLFCRWNVNDAALYLLTPPQQRVTPDLVHV